LAGSAGYAIAETFGWKEGLGKRFRDAHGFYAIIALATVVGLLVNASSIGSMTMLYYAAMLNGILAPPLLIFILLIGNNKAILGERTNSKLSNALGIVITTIMSLVALGFLWVMLRS